MRLVSPTHLPKPSPPSRPASTGLLSPCERSVPVRVGESPDVNLNNAMELA
jgi:hypothetical protein